MATYYSSALKATTSNQFAIASNSVSAFLFYPAVSGNNANVEIAYNTSGLGTPSVTASSAINITTTWGDVVKTVVYHNVSTVTVIITSLLNRQSNQVVFTPSSVRAITAVAVTNIGVGGAWTPEDARKRLLGYI